MSKQIGSQTMLRIQRAGHKVQGTLLRLKTACLKQLDDKSVDPVQQHRRQMEVLGGTALGLMLVLGFILFNAYAGAQHLKAGIAAVKSGEARLAINELSAATAIPMAPITAYEYRAIAYGMNGDYALSSADFSRVIAAQPNNADAYMGRACQRLKNLDYQNAIVDFNKALKLQPNRVEVYRLLAAAHWKLRNYTAAASDCNTYLSANTELPVDHKVSALVLLASALHESDKSRQATLSAIDACSHAIQLNKKDPRPLQKRARLRKELNQTAAAISDCTSAIALDPTAELYQLRSSCYQQSGDPSAAMKDLDHAVKLASNNLNLRNDRATLAISMQDYTKALEDAKYTLAAAPTNRQANDLFTKVRKLTGADRTIVIASSKFGGDSGTPANSLSPTTDGATPETVRGYRLLAAGKNAEAITVLGSVVTKDPNNALARRYLAHALMSNGQTDAASEQFAMLSSRGKLTAQDVLATARSAEDAGNITLAATQYEKYLTMNPVDAETRLALVQLYQRAGCVEQAMATAREGSKRARNPQEAGVFARAVIQAGTAATTQ